MAPDATTDIQKHACAHSLARAVLCLSGSGNFAPLVSPSLNNSDAQVLGGITHEGSEGAGGGRGASLQLDHEVSARPLKTEPDAAACLA